MLCCLGLMTAAVQSSQVQYQHNVRGFLIHGLKWNWRRWRMTFVQHVADKRLILEARGKDGKEI